ncbi:hypothetical protein KGQ19_00105 [Catenulispora sp. NL8]|uniref:LigA protein n=1 Tax=Catenulispora pinistramenti TaxID=2705254 RepID=A0ABS5KGC7_9ACTN|nr:hypothetical protein [Catenulispora pinistramenti]MBS2545259.1 hypothetical protein [Catenulispora pinistramenti]
MPEDPGSQLTALTELAAPATAIDLYKACDDGYRLRLRRRRTNRALTGTAAVGVLGVAATVLTIAHSPATHGAGQQAAGQLPAGQQVTTGGPTSPPTTAGGAPHSPSTAPSTPGPGIAQTGGVRVPASFGWLPQGMAFIDEGPSAGTSTYTAAAGTTAGKAAGQPRVFLSVGDTGPASMSSKIPVQGLGTSAYWVAGTGQSVVPGQADLIWQDSSGKWLTVSGDSLDPATAAATLEHVARTIVVGQAPLPLPIQIRGLAPAALGVNQVVLTHPAPGHTGPANLNIGLNTTDDSLSVFVEPTGTTQGPWTWGTSACKDSGGWNICVVADPRAATELPGGVNGLLAHIQGLGTDPAHWSADLFAN